jgi:hypothetical protein
MEKVYKKAKGKVFERATCERCCAGLVVDIWQGRVVDEDDDRGLILKN